MVAYIASRKHAESLPMGIDPMNCWRLLEVSITSLSGPQKWLSDTEPASGVVVVSMRRAWMGVFDLQC